MQRQHGAQALCHAGRNSLCCQAMLRKIGNNPQRSHTLRTLSVERLVAGQLTPERAVGPVELKHIPGRGRGLVAREDVAPGGLLFVSTPLGAPLMGPAGAALRPEDLLAHWASSPAAALSPTDRHKLSLLHRPGTTPPPCSLRDFGEAKAAVKARKAGARGFGSAGAAIEQQQQPSGTGGALDDAALAATVAANAYGGDEGLDAALAWCRGEPQSSIIGVWPEASLLNHSCAPNTVLPVLVAGRLLVRAAQPLPAGTEATASYLGDAGGVPLQQRRRLLADTHGFVCSCPRCEAEVATSAPVSAALDALHEWSAGTAAPEALLTLMAQGDDEQLKALQQQGDALLADLENALTDLGSDAPRGARRWLRASAYGGIAAAARLQEWLAGRRATDSAAQLADLVQVFAPASEPHLLLLSDSAVRAAEAAAGASGDTAAAAAAEQEGRVRLLVQALALRYGQPRTVETLTHLAGALQQALSPHWLGLVDRSGSSGLAALIASLGEAAASHSDVDGVAATTKHSGAAGGPRRTKGELTLPGVEEQLGSAAASGSTP